MGGYSIINFILKSFTCNFFVQLKKFQFPKHSIKTSILIFWGKKGGILHLKILSCKASSWQVFTNIAIMSILIRTGILLKCNLVYIMDTKYENYAINIFFNSFGLHMINV